VRVWTTRIASDTNFSNFWRNRAIHKEQDRLGPGGWLPGADACQTVPNLSQNGMMSFPGSDIAFEVAHDATVLTRNTVDFRMVPALRVENWLD
jgi:hypothetical protein